MTNIIKQIRRIIGNDWTSQIHFSYDTRRNMDCETTSSKLTSDMLYELHLIVILLNNNINVLRDLVNNSPLRV